MSSSFSIACIPGDGVGPEVTTEAVKVLESVTSDTDLRFEFHRYGLGGQHYLSTGEVLPASVLEELSAHQAILLGAVGTPEVAPGVLERGLLLAIRFEFDLYVNLRPVRLFAGVQSPITATSSEVDMVVVRENTEGPYAGVGGTLRIGTPEEVALEDSVNTRKGVERLVRFGYELAQNRSQHLTLCHKTNVLSYAGSLWERTVNEVGAEYEEIRTDYVHVDAACLYMVTNPQRFDVIVTDNLFGDIVTDLGAAIQGGMGLAASANLNPTGAYPSLFEPVHGSAPDIAGTGQANPIAAILSAGMLVDHLQFPELSRRIETAVAAVLLNTKGDPNHAYTTSEIGDMVVAQLSNPIS